MPEQSCKPARLDAQILNQAISETLCGIVITDATQPDNPIVFVNPAFERLTGYTLPEVLGKNPRFLQGPSPSDSVISLRNPLKRALINNRSCSVTLKNYRKDGTPYWVELTMAPLRDASGHVTHYVGIQTDITELKNTQQDLKKVFNKTVVGCVQAFMDSLALTCPTAYRIATRVTKLADQTAECWPIESAWELHCASMLSHLGCITVSEDLLVKHEQRKPMTPDEVELIEGHPAQGARLLSHIPHFTDVALGIKHQRTYYDPQDNRDNHGLRGDGIPLLARVLGVLVEYDRLVTQPMSPQQAVSHMAAQTGRFDPTLLDRLKRLIPDLQDPTGEFQWVERRLAINQLGPQMVAAQDLYDSQGVLLLSKGLELNATLRLCLCNYQRLGRISGLIDVKVKLYTRQAATTC